jgi:hypothetical protein
MTRSFIPALERPLARRSGTATKLSALSAKRQTLQTMTGIDTRSAPRLHRFGACRTNSIKPDDGGAVPRPTIRVSKSESAHGSVTTLIPIDARTVPPVSDKKRMS